MDGCLYERGSFFPDALLLWCFAFLRDARQNGYVKYGVLAERHLNFSPGSSLNAVFLSCRKGILLYLLAMFCQTIIGLLNSYLLFGTVSSFLGDTSQASVFGWGVIVAYFVGLLGRMAANAWMGRRSAELYLALQTSVRFVVAHKIFDLNFQMLEKGKVTSFFSSDIDAVCQRLIGLVNLSFSVMTFVGALSLVVSLFSFMAFPVLGLWACLFASQFVMGHEVMKLEDKRMPIMDSRLEKSQELFDGITTVKYQCLEDVLLNKIVEVRREEVGNLYVQEIAESVMNIFLPDIFSRMPSVLVFGLFLGLGNPLNMFVFTAINLFDLCGIYFDSFSALFQQFSLSSANHKRLTNFLGDRCVTTGGIVAFSDVHKQISLSDASFCYVSNNPDCFRLLGINFDLAIGEMILVTGKSGCGKTTMLLGILGEVELVSGFCKSSRSIAYSPQCTWSCSGSLRENILFGSEFDEEKYGHALHVSCLAADLSCFVEGDSMMISEAAGNLSGGQKQRLSIARAVYAGKDFLLMDDSLSALDARVSRIVFRRLKQLKSCGTVLCCHQDQYSIYCDRHFFFADSGRLEEVVASGTEFVDEIDETKHVIFVASDIKQNFAKKPYTGLNRRFAAEFFSKSFLSFPSFVCLSLIFASTGFVFYSSFWLVFLLDGSFVASTTIWIVVYFALLFGSSSLLVVGRVIFSFHMINFSTVVHNKGVEAVCRTFMHFFSRNSSGQIVSRFANDIGILDRNAYSLAIFFVDISFVLGTCIVVGKSVPLMLCVVPPVTLLLYAVFALYLPGSDMTQRDSMQAKAVMISSIKNLASGTVLIRSRRAERFFLDKFRSACNTHSLMVFVRSNLGIWYNMFVDVSNALFIFGVCIFALFFRSSGSESSLVLLYNTQLVSRIQSLFQKFVFFNFCSVSADRLFDYTNLESEFCKGEIPPQVWPSKGVVEFSKVSVRYDQHLPDIVMNISFLVASGWHVGIVGRTGAGKSTLAGALFRHYPFSGRISIDGVDVKTVNLFDLRSRLGMIPQEPIVFDGTLRENVDPQGIYSQQDIETLLRQSGIIGIPTSENLSQTPLSKGVSQLVCASRSLIKNPKLLVQDESTASLDQKSEEGLRSLIEEKTRGITSLIVAHRITNVLNCERVLVLEKGKVLEYRSPSELSSDPLSYFFSLLADSRSDQTQLLDEAVRKEKCCFICDATASQRQRQLECGKCSQIVCAFCNKNGICYYCWDEDDRRNPTAVSAFVLAGAYDFDLPHREKCHSCASEWTIECAICQNRFCYSCSTFVRPFVAELLSLTEKHVCRKCTPKFFHALKTMCGNSSDVFEELYHAEPFSLSFVNGTCLLCKTKGCTTKCVFCHAFVCPRQTCAGLVYAESACCDKAVFVCATCIVITTCRRKLNGEPSNFLFLTCAQVTGLSSGKTCCACSCGLSLLVQPYQCTSCKKMFCIQCVEVDVETCTCKCTDCRRWNTISYHEDLCDVCKQVVTLNMVWINQRRLHADCVAKYRSIQKSMDNSCAYCTTVFTGGESRMMFNNSFVHSDCLILYKKNRGVGARQT